MNRRPHLTLVALIVAGLIGVGLLAVPGSPLEQTPTLGLDLQGGLEVTLQAVPPPNRPLQKSDLSRSVEILRDRVDRRTEPSVTRHTFRRSLGRQPHSQGRGNHPARTRRCCSQQRAVKTAREDLR